MQISPKACLKWPEKLLNLTIAGNIYHKVYALLTKMFSFWRHEVSFAGNLFPKTVLAQNGSFDGIFMGGLTPISYNI